MALPVNTTLQGGRYEIKRFVAAGGFGCTYEGVHTGLDKRVAIKEFFVKDFCNRNQTTSEITVGVTSKTALFHKLRKKFVEEARALCKLDHPNIVKVSDVFDENGTSYFVMDYIDGPSLKDIVDSKGPLSESKAVEYILQIADALAYVHKNNRLHLDVKPGNIMINAKGKAQLIDFGASKQYEEESGENTSTVAGYTVGYAPTEQMGNDIKKFTPATDVYALGATLYNILSGIKPISAATISSGEKQKSLPQHISSVTRNAIEKAMQINKMQRPQSMAEFVDLFSFAGDSNQNEDDTVYAGKVETPKEVKKDVKPEKPSSMKNEKPNIHQSGNKNNKKWIGIAVVAIIAIIGLFALGGNGTDNSGSAKDSINAVVDNLPKVERVNGVTCKDAEGKDFTYTGDFVDGKPNGEGMGIYPYGNYTGKYKNGLREGKGKFDSKDGSNKYEGTFVNDQYDKGKLTNKDGFYYEGKFKDGQPYNGKWYNKDGSFNSEVVNGK